MAEVFVTGYSICPGYQLSSSEINKGVKSCVTRRSHLVVSIFPAYVCVG